MLLPGAVLRPGGRRALLLPFLVEDPVTPHLGTTE